MSRKGHLAIWMSATGLLVFIGVALKSYRQAIGDPVDSYDPWISTVARGPLRLERRGLGTLVRAQYSKKLVARITLPAGLADGIQLHQKAEVDTHKAVLKGQVCDISALRSDGARSIDIALYAKLPTGIGETPNVDVTIKLGELEDVLYVGRPVHAHANTTLSVFKLVDGGEAAVRVGVHFGRASVNTIEILDGLKEGDRIFTCDMSAWDQFDRIRLK